MSDKPSSSSAPSDDFFGIEYISSTNNQHETTQQPQPNSENSVERRAYKMLVEDRYRNVDDSQNDVVDGTDFMDDAFFPGHQKYTRKSQQTQNEPATEASYGIIEEQYMQRVKRPLNVENIGEDEISKSGQVIKSTTEKRVKQKKPKMSSDYVSYDEEPRREPSALDHIRSKYVPVWNFDKQTLIDYVVKNVLYRDDKVVAFDKPYGLSYSGGPTHRPQFDRLLQEIKFVVAPKCERLYLVKSLDRHQSGIMLFATNALLQSELREQFTSGMIENVYSCIVKGKLDKDCNITIPLIKSVKDGNFQLRPLVTNKQNGDILYVETACKLVRSDGFVSTIEARTKKEVPHQIRAHLGLAGFPLIGDPKYSGHPPSPPGLQSQVLSKLGIEAKHARKLSMFMHLKEMNIPSVSKDGPLRLTAPLPGHFTFMLKKLRLLKR